MDFKQAVESLFPKQIRKKLKKKLQSKYQKEVQFKEKLDSTIIGGLIARFDHHMIDASIKSRLYQLKKNLLATRSACN